MAAFGHNKPFAEQKCWPGVIDLICGVNAWHCDRNIVGFLPRCRITLGDGGKSGFRRACAHETREMAARELALNLSVYHRSAAIHNPEYRKNARLSCARVMVADAPAGGLQRGRGLLDALSSTFPNQYAAVIAADK
jgi:hypothetical protein